MSRPSDSGVLRGAGRGAGVLLHVEKLVVDDRNRLEQEVVAPIVVHRVDQIREHPEARVAELAGARPPAFDVPLEVLTVLRQPADVLPQRELVDGVVAEAAPDEDQPGAASHRSHRPECDVDAPELVRGRDGGALQHRRQHHGVDVGAVARQQRHGVPAIEVLESRHLRVVVADAPAVRGPVEEPGDVQEHVARGTAVRGHHLVQVGVQLGGDVRDGAIGGGRDRGDALTHLDPSEDLGPHLSGGHRVGQLARVSR